MIQQREEVEIKNGSMINTWDDMKKEFPVREIMTPEQEKEFVSHCFTLYEKEGFSKVFWTPYEDFNAFIGKKFSVLGRISDTEVDMEVLPMWRIRFDNGRETNAYPEEIIPFEMRANGCTLEGIASI